MVQDTNVKPAVIFTNNFENNCHIMTVVQKLNKSKMRDVPIYTWLE